MGKQKVLFICNPIAGHRKAAIVIGLLETHLDHNKYDYEVAITSHAGHAETLARETTATIVVAVGGDGTVNEILRGISGQGKTLGIIPCGSGNGLAYHHMIPSAPTKAIEVLNKGHKQALDIGTINDHLFGCTCGVGMDAEVSYRFSKGKARGLFSYIIDTVKIFFTYKAKRYTLTIDDVPHELYAKMITVGNANQWGNHALVTPKAETNDQVLNVTVLEKLSLLNVVPLLIRLFRGDVDKGYGVKTFCGKMISIQRDHGGPIHYDGESDSTGDSIAIELTPSNMHIITNR